MRTNSFPFKTKLDFAPLEKYWKDHFDKDEYTPLLKSRNPKQWINKNKESAKRLFSILFPLAQNQSEIVAGMAPFVYESFYATERYHELLPDESVFEIAKTNVHRIPVSDGKIIKACIMILEKVHNFDIKLEKAITFQLPDPRTGLNKIYKLEVDERFISIKKNKGARKPDAKTVKQLIDDRYNLEQWLEVLKPEHYTFTGFMVLRLTDVTSGEMISSIKADLLQKDSVLKEDIFNRTQEYLRSLFNTPDLKLGLAFFDLEKNLITPSKSGWNSVIVDCHSSFKCDYHAGSLYERAYLEQRIINIEDLNKQKHLSKVERNLTKMGVKNIVVAPLISNGEVLGMLELASPNAGAVSIINSHLLEAILPIFVIAVERVIDDMETEVRSIIQQEFTSIHPAVTWKFYEEGIRILQNRRAGERDKLLDVKFSNVNPIYGLSDIRNSSEVRTDAIREDLLDSINYTEKIIEGIIKINNLDILRQLCYKLEKYKQIIENNVNSENESLVLSLFSNEINPILYHFSKQDENIRELYNSYKKKLNGEVVMLQRRRSFEVSVNKLNETLASHLLKQQEKVQKLFPHYFEFFKTDGVEYNIYVGQSLVKDKEYHDLYFRNLRLWQLVVTAEMAVISEDLKESLPIPLTVAHLILVQNEAIDIKFRQDEKRFDVDGAYNVRYEIVKKRIDKAYIKGTKERVTQPGKIAIIYSHSKDIEEYRNYIKYLQHLNVLEDKVEELALEELPGAGGLKALRVEVRKEIPVTDWSSEMLQSIVAQIEVNN